MQKVKQLFQLWSPYAMQIVLLASGQAKKKYTGSQKERKNNNFFVIAHLQMYSTMNLFLHISNMKLGSAIVR